VRLSFQRLLRPCGHIEIVPPRRDLPARQLEHAHDGACRPVLRWRLATTQKGMEPIARSRADAAPKCVAFRCILLHFGAPNSHSTSRRRSADEHKANLLTPVIRVTRVRTRQRPLDSWRAFRRAAVRSGLVGYGAN